MSVDQRVFDLAVEFLEESKLPYDEIQLSDFAEAIQKTIEDWLENYSDSEQFKGGS